MIASNAWPPDRIGHFSKSKTFFCSFPFRMANIRLFSFNTKSLRFFFQFLLF